LNLLVKPIFILGIDAEVQNQVGAEAYGLYFALLNLSFIFNILIDFGINNFNNRNIAQNELLISKHYSRLFSIKSILALVYALITLILGWIMGYGAHAQILFVLVVNQIIVSFIQFNRSNLAALHLFKKDSIVSISDRFLLIVFCSILLFTRITDQPFQIEWFVYLQTLAYSLTWILSFLMLRTSISKLKWYLDLKFSRVILKRSIPYALLILMGSIYYRVDGIMLEKLSTKGAEEVGYYAQGYRFFEAAGMFAHLFAVILLPMYARLLKTNFEEVRKLLEMAARLLVGVCIAAAVVVYFNSDVILNWRYVNVEASAISSFVYVMIGFVGVGMFYIYGTLMTANEDLKELNLIALGGLVINLILNFWLIPSHGAPGAAVATMCTQLFAGLAQLIFVVRKFKLGINWRMSFQFAAFFTLFFLVNQFLMSSFFDPTIIRVIVSSLLSLVLLHLSGLFPIHRIRSFQKNME
jgi:O-antigen/teichoic acid export membrane protein